MKMSIEAVIFIVVFLLHTGSAIIELGPEQLSMIMKESDDILPSELVSFELLPQNKQSFYLNVTDAPATVKLTYVVTGPSNNVVRFTLYNPTQVIMESKDSFSEFSSSFFVPAKGEYRIEFLNREVSLYIS
eukprot:TRINITY_DN15154_c0_g1_i2.p2 TRINITY_DN15154_c0_g1~~TRINITY_DN15154_c0_g1_i2.p2  ORF type:complete len:131 (+),score=18.54 TRINITY_DN15154_c0_g1_i2:121-513(+)